MSAAHAFPPLQTPRLTLEPLAWRHADGMFALWSSPEVCEHSGEARDLDGQPIRLPAVRHADSDKILAFFVERARRGTGVRWAVLHREDARFLGAVGLNSLSPVAEIAYHLHPDHWGSGYATEACAAILAWLRDERPGASIEAYVEPDNPASAAVAGRLGLVAEADMREGARRFTLRL